MDVEKLLNKGRLKLCTMDIGLSTGTEKRHLRKKKFPFNFSALFVLKSEAFLQVWSVCPYINFKLCKIIPLAVEYLLGS